jgi:hypothetical protein
MMPASEHDTSEDEGGHPMDDCLQKRYQQRGDSGAQGGQESSDGCDDPEQEGGSSSGSDRDEGDSGSGGSDEPEQHTPAPGKDAPKPAGVILVDEDEMQQARTYERLLRMPRYFDENVEAAAFARQVRCYRCGQAGHVARSCTSQTLKPCSLCAETDHEAAECPNSELPPPPAALLCSRPAGTGRPPATAGAGRRTASA